MFNLSFPTNVLFEKLRGSEKVYIDSHLTLLGIDISDQFVSSLDVIRCVVSDFYIWIMLSFTTISTCTKIQR